MGEKMKLAYLRVQKDLVQAYHADMPAGDPVTMLFHGPIDIPVPKEHELREILAATPLFDYQKDEILWACQGGPSLSGTGSPDENYGAYINTTHVWRIGSHFALQSLEHTGLQGTYRTKPTVMLDSGIDSVGVMTCKDLNDDFKIGIAQRVGEKQKADDNPWVIVPFKTSSKPQVLNQSRLFAGTDSTMRYIYNLTNSHDSNSKTLYLDVIKSANFKELNRNSSLLWQHFEIQIDFEVIEDSLPRLFTHDQVTGKHRLYLFKMNNAKTCIEVTYVNLRKDGSLDSDQAKFKAHGGGRITVPKQKSPTGLCAFDHDGKVLLTWHNDAGAQGLLATIANDGAVPYESGWTKVDITFEKPIQAKSNTYGLYGVLVPSDFI